MERNARYYSLSKSSRVMNFIVHTKSSYYSDTCKYVNFTVQSAYPDNRLIRLTPKRRSNTSPTPLIPHAHSSVHGHITHPRILTQARRQILHLRSPRTFCISQPQHQFLPLGEKAMINPILSVRNTVQSSALYVNRLVTRIEILSRNRCGFAGDGRADRHRREEGRCDKIDVLAGVWE
jgi:hypothetical protein